MVYKRIERWVEKRRKATLSRLNGLWEIAFPPTCVLCGGDGSGHMDLCAGCRWELPRVDIACYFCGLPLTGGGMEADGQARCGRCIRRPSRFDRTCCPYVYREPVDWLIRQLKFHARMPHIRVLSGLLQQHLEQIGVDLPDAIIPVPMHPGRQRRRGFNQALEIARPLARYFGVPLVAGLCERRLDTVPQSELPAKRRGSNVRNAFRLRGPLAAGRVAIVDDVMTTGATANELAGLLKRHGAEHVQIWVLARTVAG